MAEALPNAPLPNEVNEAEMDEMFTFIGDKKRNLYCYSGRSQDTLYFGLDGGLGSNYGNEQNSF